MIAERIAWMSTPVRKNDGEMRARIESWQAVDRIFDRFVRPRLGKKIASEVTARDVAELSDDVVNGKLGKASVSNARHMRRAVSGLFRCAAQPSRGYVSASPCINLEPLDKEPPRTRRLSPAEIKTLWHGLDRPDLVIDRRICLAIKFTLLTCLRSIEALHIHRDELVDLDGKFPRVDVPLRRVKKRRTISQPLSGLAVELINEALTGDDQAFVFAGRFGNAPLHRLAMACALRRYAKDQRAVQGARHQAVHAARPEKNGGEPDGQPRHPRSTVALRLDHAATDDSGGAVPKVTGIYDQDPRLKEKRDALEKLAAEIRRIVAEPVQVKRVDRLAA